MSEAASETELPPALTKWLENLLGQPLTAVSRVPGGASRLSYLIDHAGGGAFLRMDTGRSQLSGTVYNLEREAKVLSALSDSGVAVPAILGFSSEFQAVLMQRVDGSTDYFGVGDAATKVALEAALIGQLASLHGWRFDAAALFGAGSPPTLAGALRAEIALWRGLSAARLPVPDPALDFALDWLDRNVPADDRPPSLVHGDIGPGNFMFAGDRITALIDWELVHAGHPLEDLASVVARTLGIPFGTIPGHIAAYEAASGRPVDRTELAYCLALVLTRFCIGMSIALAMAQPEMDLPMMLRYLQPNRHALLRLLARQSGGAVPPMPAPQAESPGDTGDGQATLFSYAIQNLEEKIAPAGDAFLRHRAAGIANLLRYLRDLAAYGTDRWRQEEIDGLAQLIGQPVSDLASGYRQFAVRLPQADDDARRAMVAYLLERSSRRHVLMQGTLGPMFDRSIDLEQA